MAWALLVAGDPRVLAAGDPEVSPELGSPGILGFVFTFLLALALVGLALLLVRQLRRVDRRAASLPPDASTSTPTTPSATSESSSAIPPKVSDVADEREKEGEGDGDDEGRRGRP